MYVLNRNYVAGLFDGEGSIGVYKRKDSRISRGFSISYRVRLVNQYKSILQELHKLHGGRLRRKSNKIECWELELDTKEQIMNFLKTYSSYMIIKKSKAKKLLNYLESKSKQGRSVNLNEKDIKFIEQF